MKPSLGQIDALVRVLEDEDNVQIQFNTENLYDVISEVTPGQYDYLYALIFNNKHLKLRALLIDLGLKLKV